MIYLSAGHSNMDPGAVALGRKEADLTKVVRDSILSNLDRKTVVTDKDTEDNRTYQARINPTQKDIVLDIHFNAGSSAASGVECFVNTASFMAKNSAFKMASEINSLLSSSMAIANRGVKPENISQHKKIGILNKGAGISVLVEVCFISSATDMQRFFLKREEICKGIATILKKYNVLLH